MGKRGPQKTPTAILTLRGSELPSRRGSDLPAVAGTPEAPDWLSGEGLAEWNRQVADLGQRGILTVSDRGALALYCDAWSDYVGAVRDIEENGTTVKAKADQVYANPAFGIKKSAFDRMNRIGQQFGFTPSSRAGLGERKKDAEVDAFEQWEKKSG